MTIKRDFWLASLNKCWNKKSIIWLAGVRRSGKTSLAKQLEDTTFINCDLPSQRDRLEDPEEFLSNVKSKHLVLDEIHQLPEASQLLKIAADEYPKLKILATGSSTLIASKKFNDSLTGRKINLHFLPILVNELKSFNSENLNLRILRGGLPQALMADELDLDFYAEWLDSYYARDIQELYSVEKRQPFLKALEYLLVHNGHCIEVTALAQAAGISRPTAIKYLDVFESTKAITIVRPFSGNAANEIVSQPKVYGFDTGFSCYSKGIRELRNEDKGNLLENLVLETLQANVLGTQIKYWRTKQKQEIDFILELNKKKVITLECKWNENSFSPDHVLSFRKNFPEGENWVVTSGQITRIKKIKGLQFKFIGITNLLGELEKIH